MNLSNSYVIGGEGGIRTHGTLQTHANFQDWCHKPTRPPLHVSKTFFILTYFQGFCQYLFEFIINYFFIIIHIFQILLFLQHIFLYFLYILLQVQFLDKYLHFLLYKSKTVYFPSLLLFL